MSDVTLITPPDSLVNDIYSVLLVYPQIEVKNALSEILEKVDTPINIYLYEELDDIHIDWLMTEVRKVNTVIIDLDNCTPTVKNIAGWIVSRPNTFYLTNDTITPYNLLNVNQIYDLHWLESYIKRGLNEI
jgi:hypothetical protein